MRGISGRTGSRGAISLLAEAAVPAKADWDDGYGRPGWRDPHRTWGPGYYRHGYARPVVVVHAGSSSCVARSSLCVVPSSWFGSDASG